VIEKGGVKIPMLDLSSIYIQREVVSSNNENSNSEEENDSQYLDKEEADDDSDIDSKGKKEKFEQQKNAFK
jgi:hypothetical protein